MVLREPNPCSGLRGKIRKSSPHFHELSGQDLFDTLLPDDLAFHSTSYHPGELLSLLFAAQKKCNVAASTGGRRKGESGC